MSKTHSILQRKKNNYVFTSILIHMDIQIKPKKWKALPISSRKKILYRSQKDIDSFLKKVIPIVDDVKKNGDKALCKYTKKFEGATIEPNSLKVSEQEFKDAEKKLSKEIKKALSIAMRNVHNYHAQHYKKSGNVLSEISKGVFAGQHSTPLDSVGMYIPQGKGSFPSMAYMLAIPAQIANVPRRVMISPPYKDGSIDAASLYIAKMTGIHEVYKVGGAQGIAALAFGTKKIEPVIKILGPGSAFVSAAKKYVSNVVDIGLPAGPSESVIISDGTTNAHNLAYDLCIEAEHGKDSMALVLIHKKDYAHTICKHLNKIIKNAPTAQKSILSAVFKKYPPVILTENEDHSIEISNEIAPEHLMLHSLSPSFMVADIKNAGEILIGEHSAFSLANYATGPNAILPTGGMAKSFSGLSVNDFTKKSTLIKISKEGHTLLSPHVQNLAKYEGFHFHRQALKKRIITDKK